MQKLFENKDAYMHNQIMQWKFSGLSQAEFCRREQISLKSFEYYKSKFLRMISDHSCENNLPVAKENLLPVHIVSDEKEENPEQVTSSNIHIQLKNIGELILPDNFNPHCLKKILEVISTL